MIGTSASRCDHSVLSTAVGIPAVSMRIASELFGEVGGVIKSAYSGFDSLLERIQSGAVFFDPVEVQNAQPRPGEAPQPDCVAIERASGRRAGVERNWSQENLKKRFQPVLSPAI